MPLAIPEGDVFHDFHKKNPAVIIFNNEVIRAAEELNQQIRHVGLVNIMPSPAFKQTEMQFILPLQYASGDTIVVPHFMTLDGIPRDDYPEIQKRIEENYLTLKTGEMDGISKLDGLIISGANIIAEDLTSHKIYESFKNLVNWTKSDDGPRSTIYSCMSTHLYMLLEHGKKRRHFDDKKCWGVYKHDVVNHNHPLTKGMENTVDIPHSRWNDISEQQFRDAGIDVLIKSKEVGVHMAATPDGSAIFHQGHPEYDAISLALEWTRDLNTTIAEHLGNKRTPWPPFPDNYFKDNALLLAQAHFDRVKDGHYNTSEKKGNFSPEVRQEMREKINNSWESARQACAVSWVKALNAPAKKSLFENSFQEDDLPHNEM